jgi:hypothetical protein
MTAQLRMHLIMLIQEFPIQRKTGDEPKSAKRPAMLTHGRAFFFQSNQAFQANGHFVSA